VALAAVTLKVRTPLATESAPGTLHSVSLWAYSPWREMTVHALGSLTPFTTEVFKEPAAICWQNESVQFSVLPHAVLDTGATDTVAFADGDGAARAVASTVSIRSLKAQCRHRSG
jgi:hypothetical protein